MQKKDRSYLYFFQVCVKALLVIYQLFGNLLKYKNLNGPKMNVAARKIM